MNTTTITQVNITPYNKAEDKQWMTMQFIMTTCDAFAISSLLKLHSKSKIGIFKKYPQMKIDMQELTTRKFTFEELKNFDITYPYQIIEQLDIEVDDNYKNLTEFA